MSEAVMEAVRTIYPDARGVAKKLVRAHIKDPDGRILLAIYYAPRRRPQDIFLFEVIENFGANTIDEGRDLFEVSFGSTDALPLEPGQHLHLVLTGEEEFRTAVKENWRLLAELRRAIKQGKAEVLYSEPGKAGLRVLLDV